MKFYKTSRKDDIISLFYLIIFLLNNKKFVCRKEDEHHLEGIELADKDELFSKIRKYKLSNKFSDLAYMLVLNMEIFSSEEYIRPATIVKKNIIMK